jgi:hypothetical protein
MLTLRHVCAQCHQTFIQDGWLDRMVEACRDRPPLAVVVSHKWDETRELVPLATTENAGGAQVDDVQIMVSSCRVVISWGTKVPTFCFDVICPPVPLMQNSADDIHAGLIRHPFKVFKHVFWSSPCW